MTDDDNGILGDHHRHKTKFVPPFLQAMGDSFVAVRWQYESIPEYLWIALLIQEFELEEASEITRDCARSAQDLFEGGHFVLSTDYDKLSNAQLEELRKDLGKDTAGQIDEALGVLCHHYPTFPQSGLIDEPEEVDEDSIEKLMWVVDNLSSRRSKLSMLSQGIHIAALLETDQLKFSSEAAEGFGDINDLIDYPHTDESQKVASSVRASIKGIRAGDDEPIQSEWAKRFWRRGFEITDCIFPEQVEEETDEWEEDPNEDFYEELQTLGFEYEEDLRNTVLELWMGAEHDPKFTGKNSVLDGLLMRQINLTTYLATSPSMWYPETSGIILRCLSETHITLEWFNQEAEEEDYEEFIEYGLGQEKLSLEHFASMSKEKDVPEDLEKGLDSMKDRLNEQKYTYLIPVDVGSWNKDTRTMAEEAGCKEDVYDNRFSFHSPTVHGMWNAIEKQSLSKCMNPLHSYHRIPMFGRPTLIPFAVVEAGNLMRRSFVSWSEARGVDIEDVELIDLPGAAKEIISKYSTRNIADGLGNGG